MARARTVAVVVPSPATSLVLLATWAPADLKEQAAKCWLNEALIGFKLEKLWDIIGLFEEKV